jgi:hypothetical protein
MYFCIDFRSLFLGSNVFSDEGRLPFCRGSVLAMFYSILLAQEIKHEHSKLHAQSALLQKLGKLSLNRSLQRSRSEPVSLRAITASSAKIVSRPPARPKLYPRSMSARNWKSLLRQIKWVDGE